MPKLNAPSSVTAHAEPCDWLRQEYERRRARNPYFSQRAFSRLLGIPSGRLSELMSRRRGLSPRLAQQIAERLGYSSEARAAVASLARESKQTRTRRKRLSAYAAEALSTSEYQQMADDVFAAVSDWHHWGLLNLLRTDDCRYQPAWFARRLGIDVALVREALRRLERLGLLQRQGKKWVRTAHQLRSTSDIPSPALRSAHKQCLALAARSLEEVPVELRDVSTMMIAIDPASLPEAKQMIRNFRRGLAEHLERGRRREVYALNISLFPLSRGKAKA